jgi:uncharacterized protein (DUF1697 family)
MKHIALLRGINVGGKNKVAMKDLAAACEAAGATAVRTYIQSGNVVFDGAAAVAWRAQAEIAKRFGVPAVLRTSAELAKVIDAAPFPVEHLHVGFLDSAPRAVALDPARSPGDAFAIHGREIYLHLPNGMARTKLTNAWFDRQLAAVSTFRNWRTVLALAALTRAAGRSAPARSRPGR